MKTLHVAAAALAMALAGCATMNDALTPSAQVINDDFDGSTIIRQEPVSASGGMGEDWHTLGFEWVSKSPDTVFVYAGVFGIENITAVAFNADGRIIDQIEVASVLTDTGDIGHTPSWSTRRFKMSWTDFLAVAKAQSVKMKITRIDTYTVSSFGPSSPNASVNSKFAPFLAAVEQSRTP